MPTVATDGSWNVTNVTTAVLADPTLVTGMHAEDGSMNVFVWQDTDDLADAFVDSPIGSTHPCGAMNVLISTSSPLRYHSSGAIQVSETPYIDGTLKVTFV